MGDIISDGPRVSESGLADGRRSTPVMGGTTVLPMRASEPVP
jgi:hypothetical protein